MWDKTRPIAHNSTTLGPVLADVVIGGRCLWIMRL